MPFDTRQFMKTKFIPRQEAVPVPDLKEFFTDLADKEVPLWTVRGLTGQELGSCNEAAARNKNIGAILEGLADSSRKEKVASIRKLLGIGETPQDVAKRIEMLLTGSVEPSVDIELAVKLCETFPVEFYQLTTKITQLTGQGHVPGKSKASGNSQRSETP